MPSYTTFFGTYPESTTATLYHELVFKSDQVYNRQAPDPAISFTIASLLTVLMFTQYIKRYLRLKRIMPTPWKKGGILVTVRTMISCYIDTDDPVFVITKFSAQSFWFLGAMQINYATAFAFMMKIFTAESILDSLRVILAVYESDSLKNYIPTSDSFIKRKEQSFVELLPTNVYEDLTRSFLVVLVVFVAQVLLICFVVVDMYAAPTMTCPDGTTGCPVVGTLGSWCVYLLGIFLALTYLLGPKTSYGSSEQNPAFWLRLLLTVKSAHSNGEGAKVSWYDPVKEHNFCYTLSPYDWRLWLRFFMSFLVNGVGFHILVHALPIQVSAQSTFLMVVFRSVGMMHLVDMDDSAGYKLRLEEEGGNSNAAEPTAKNNSPKNKDQISVEAQKIIDEAKTKLDCLLKDERYKM